MCSVVALQYKKKRENIQDIAHDSDNKKQKSSPWFQRNITERAKYRSRTRIRGKATRGEQLIISQCNFNIENFPLLLKKPVFASRNIVLQKNNRPISEVTSRHVISLTGGEASKQIL